MPIQVNDNTDIVESLNSKFNENERYAIDLEEIDMDYKTFLDFLIDNVHCIKSYTPVDLHMIRAANEYLWGAQFKKEYENMINMYRQERYEEGLRLLRPLVQQAMEIVLTKKNIPFKTRTITSLSQLLQDKGIIDVELKKWFDIVTSYSNYPTHTISPFPQPISSEPWLRDRLIFTFSIGMNLINELENPNYHI